MNAPANKRPANKQRRLPCRAVRVLMAASLVAGVTSCSALPRSGEVHTAQPRLPAPQTADFYAGAPREGATPEQIVEGFLNAQSAGYAETGFDVARSYLLPSVAEKWNPEALVRVYAEGTTPRTSIGTDGGVVITADLTGSVDERGVYSDAAANETAELSFALARDSSGEWRIAALDDGVLLSSYVFTTIFSSQPLYFLTQDRQALVADLRWFPREDIATRVVQEILAGPAEWLADVAVSAVPPQTKLAVEKVELADGVATVDLSTEIDVLEEPDRSLSGMQLEQTLYAVATVREVIITSNEERILSDPAVPLPSSYPTSASSLPLGLRDGKIVRVSENKAPTIVDLGNGASFTGLAQAYDGSVAVVLEESKRLRAIDLGTGATRVLLEGQVLTAPSIDRAKWVWSAETGEIPTPGLRVASLSGGGSGIQAEWLEGRRVDAIAVSREGARVAIASTGDTGSRLDVASVQRDGEGTPIKLGAPVQVGAELSDVQALAWVEDVMVAALARSTPEAAQPVVNLVQIGGSVRELPLVDRAVSVTALSGARTLMVGTATGDVWVRNGAGWRVEAPGGITSPAYPG